MPENSLINSMTDLYNLESRERGGPLISDVEGRWTREVEATLRIEGNGAGLGTKRHCPESWPARRQIRQRLMFLQPGREWAGDKQKEHRVNKGPRDLWTRWGSGIGPKMPASKKEAFF